MLLGRPPALRSLYVYPWDVASQGAREFAAQALALGMTAATLALGGRAGKFVSPQHRGCRVVFAEEGAVCFEPDPRGYGEIAPVAHSDPALRHVVEDLAADGRLQLRAKLPLLHNARLGAQHPLHVVRNAWGDAYAHHLCPSSPAALEYALALSADCARLPLRGLVLEAPNWLSYAHGHERGFAQARGNLWLEALLSLCFCSHCRQRASAADLDADALAARVRARVDAYLAAPVDAAPDQAAAWLLADLLEMPQLAAYLALRQAHVAEAVAAIRARLPRDREVWAIATTRRPTANAWLEGSRLAALARACDGVEVPFYETDPARVAADAFDTVQRVGDPARVRAILRPGDDAGIGAALAAVQAAGIADVGFYNYGLLRPHRLQALAAALRAEPAGGANLTAGAA
ncbi:hypothetical protein SAMN04487939_11940 [Lysobacter sp. yr284]|uniref:hypothetical protein n=1 Tax=Lysobacter sp. yr284 TaxID=1761791 RepID=UPI000897B8C1|nr:hypothetical protein [Lysobacter sp. yr284]SDZ16237.1 hypothetical protein SAMN04487939_11940 [Lysobacter sp. yr284]